MKTQILNRYNRAVMFESDLDDLRSLIIKNKANLFRADLSRASLSGASLSKILSQRTILPDGELIGWKMLRGNIICKLKIPYDAKRVGGLVGRKCRAEFVDVLNGEGKADFDGTEYRIGKRIVPDSFDPNPLIECSHGIHFFITKQEAEDYIL